MIDNGTEPLAAQHLAVQCEEGQRWRDGENGLIYDSGEKPAGEEAGGEQPGE